MVGICRICKKEKELTFEHIPPRSAFNKRIKYYNIPTDEYWGNFVKYAINGETYGKKIQRGLGEYCLCSECNTFLGSKYVRDYKKIAEGCLSMINKYPNMQNFEFLISENINVRNFLKQVIGIFICLNNSFFAETYKELLDFITDENESNLPERYKIYMYLHNEGAPRNGKISYTNYCGTICEFCFTPLGFILNIDNPKPISGLCDITNFKHHEKRNEGEKIYMSLNKFPTYTPIPLDYRTKTEILNEK